MKLPWKKPPVARVFTGSCPVREHTGDDVYVGRCEHATFDGVCPRHGRLSDYTKNDDREIDPRDRDFTPDPAPEHR